MAATDSRKVVHLARMTRVWLTAAAVAASASLCYAQTGSAPAEVGFQPNRDYLELLPFESIDSASSNVILRFDDLVLPGNNGRELRLERVFNNRTDSARRLDIFPYGNV